MTGDRDRQGWAGEPGLLCTGQAKAACARLSMLAQTFFREQLPGSWVPPYLRFRGFGSAIQDQWQAGYAPPGWNALTYHLRTLGWVDEDIERAGLARRSRRGNLGASCRLAAVRSDLAPQE